MKKVILELTNAYGSAYIPKSQDEKLNYVTVQIKHDYESEPYDYSTEFACTMVAFIDFNDMYSILVKNFLEQDNDHDTLIVKCDLMQYVKKNNTKEVKKFINDLCHAYKTIKMAGHRRPDEIYYQSDRGQVDEYCIHSLWESADGDIYECTYEFSNIESHKNQSYL